MSHYLQSIAARSLDAVPKVEPRLAARFEAEVPPAGAVNLAAEEQKRTEERRQPLSSPREAEVSRPTSPDVLNVPAASSQPRGNPPSVTPIETIRPAMPAVPQVSPPAETIRPVEPISSIVNSPQSAETVRPAVPTTNSFSSSADSATEPDTPKDPSRSTNLQQSPRSASDTSSFSPQPSPQEVRKDSQSIGPVPVETSLPKTQVTVAQPAKVTAFQAAIPPDQHVSSPSPPAPPPIQVTIGRIDVRAVSSPPRPKAAKPAIPKRSLNDYLKARQQSLGGRG